MANHYFTKLLQGLDITKVPLNDTSIPAPKKEKKKLLKHEKALKMKQVELISHNPPQEI